MSKNIKQLDKYYMKRYGITWKQRMSIWHEQKGRCALCTRHERGFKNRLAVDHNHASGKIRGLLCYYCNKWRVGKLNTYWANKVFEYLLKYEGFNV